LTRNCIGLFPCCEQGREPYGHRLLRPDATEPPI
jgi:hypothetical protein